MLPWPQVSIQDYSPRINITYHRISDAITNDRLRVSALFEQVSQVSTDMLMHARVLGQVDEKFIACILPRQSSYQSYQAPNCILVLIDQHAAHERVLLEWLEDQYLEEIQMLPQESSSDTQLDDHTLAINMTLLPQEIRTAKEYKDYMARWNIKFSIDPIRSNRIIVHALPRAIIDYFRHQPDMLARLIRDCIHECGSRRPTNPCGSMHQHMAHCPTAIQDMLKHISCKRRCFDMFYLAHC
jgi:DNA mismatch repair ATPase MutL